jgi:lipoprotein-releasing system permease protein
MNWSVNLAKSLLKDKTLRRHHFIQKICQAAIALCITTILISSFLIRGFESKIEEKIFEFWSHIRISTISNSSNTIKENPIQLDLSKLKSTDVKKIVPVVNKGVILKYKKNIEGIILKGIPIDKLPKFTQDTAEKYLPIVLSESTMAKLNIEKNAIFFVNIIDSVPMTIKAKVVASYFTNIEEFDNQIALTDIRAIQRLNHWTEKDYSWVEVSVDKREDILYVAQKIYTKLEDVNVETIFTIFPQLFDWLALMKRNELIIFIVMIIVAMVNIISTISIFIIEKTKLIGMLKVLGARNNDLYQMIFYQVTYIILKGILIGNILTFVLTAIMYYFKPISLDPSIYYVSYAPIQFDIFVFIIINLLTIAICLLTAWIPIRAISKISPIKVVEHE